MNDAMDEMTVGGATVAWSDTGTGDPTLLVHAGVFGAWFAPLARHLPGRVIRMLRAGYTGGPPPAGLVGMADHAAHAAALLDALDTGPATVVGHSSGSLIVLQLALDRPDLVRRLVLSEPPLIDPLLDPVDVAAIHAALGPAIGAAMGATARCDRAGAYDAFMGAVCGPDHRAVVAEVLGADGLAHAERDSPFFFTNELPATGGWSGIDPARVTAPVLLVAGAESPAATHRLVARLAGLLPTRGPRRSRAPRTYCRSPTPLSSRRSSHPEGSRGRSSFCGHDRCTHDRAEQRRRHPPAGVRGVPRASR